MLDMTTEITDAIQNERIKPLNNMTARRGQYIVYWMQSSQRTEFNHALEYSIQKANELSKPLIVFFCLTGDFPQANARHYHFMLEGLKEVQSSLNNRKILMVIQIGIPPSGIIAIAKKASLVVVDRGYLRIQREWRSIASMNIECPLVQIESDVIVPVEEASPKEEFSAATFRPKIKKTVSKYLKTPNEHDPNISSLGMDFSSISLDDTNRIFSDLKVDTRVSLVKTFKGGTTQAKLKLMDFLENHLNRYFADRNDPNLKATSNLSPYLHFGQISPLYITLKALETAEEACESFLEELIVRRELAVNYAFYNQKYDSYFGLPTWAIRTLDQHRLDKREVIYKLADFEGANTHDKYWNAAQREMLYTGKMHGYMRMYWGKKILEWTERPEEAFKIALYLNNKYELDGRDTNGCTGVSWCFGKHDRPWAERPIFGNIRYMNDNGLKRKFDADKYASVDFGLLESLVPPESNSKNSKQKKPFSPN
jgi:deoxyribodipyrimidine photo-lyase